MKRKKILWFISGGICSLTIILTSFSFLAWGQTTKSTSITVASHELLITVAGIIIGFNLIFELIKKFGLIKTPTDDRIEMIHKQLILDPGFLKAYESMMRDVKSSIEDGECGLKSLRNLYSAISHAVGSSISQSEEINSNIKKIISMANAVNDCSKEIKEIHKTVKDHDEGVKFLEKMHPDPVEGTPRHFCSANLVKSDIVKTSKDLSDKVERMITKELHDRLEKAIIYNKDRERETLIKIEQISTILGKAVEHLAQIAGGKKYE